MSIFLDAASFIPLIAGTAFCAVAQAFHIDYTRFLREGRKIKGRVKAIEKYISEHKIDGRIERRTFYSPIVEYTYDGQTHSIKGIGTNEMRYKLNQPVTVMVIKTASKGKASPAACIQDSNNRLFPLVFSGLGLGALALYVFAAGGEVLVAAIALGVSLGLGTLLATQMKKAESAIGLLNQDQTPDPSEDSELIDTKAAYDKEISQHHFWGHIIAFVFMFFSIGITYLGYSGMPAEAQAMLFSDFPAFWEKLTSGSMPDDWTKSAILTGFGFIFFLASLRSVYYVRTKYGAPMRV